MDQAHLPLLSQAGPSPQRAPSTADPAQEEAAAQQSDMGNQWLAAQVASSRDLEVGPEDPLWYGVVQNDALAPEWAAKAHSIGIRAIKVRLKDTDALVPGDGMYDFILACKRQGLEVTVLFNHESVGADYVEPDLARTQARAAEVVARLQGLVDAWEIWNEPQSIEPERDMSAEQLMQVLGSVYSTFAATGAPVIAAPEWCTGQGDQFRQDMADWWQRNRWMFPDVDQEWPFDVLAVHAYFLGGWDRGALIDASMAHIQGTFGPDMPVWVTEFGYPSTPEMGYDGQRQFIEEVSGEFAKWGAVDRMFYYGLQDYPGEESGANMGLFDEEGSAKPSASAWGYKGQQAPAPAPEPAGPFSVPYPALEAQFLAHLDAIGSSDEVTKAKWDEWYPAYLANGGAPGEQLQGFTVPRPDLEEMFLEHLAATGAAGETSQAKWDEWFAAYKANGGL